MLSPSIERSLFLFVSGCLVLLLGGCGGRPAIETYTVTKEVPDRLLGGILLQENQGWFFKLTGPRSQLDAVADEFRTFLKSVKVDAASGRPDWKLPEGWEVDPRPHQMRVATIRVPFKGSKGDAAEAGEGKSTGQTEPAATHAELTVTMLPHSGADAQYLLANINRWRDQMSVGRVSAQDLASLEKIEGQSGSVLLVSIAGRQKASSMAGPMMGGRG